MISMESMLHQVTAFIHKQPLPEVKVPQMHIRSDKEHEVFTRYFDKMFQPTADKRVVRPDKTVPFGFKD
jgi:hypothetical protein